MTAVRPIPEDVTSDRLSVTVLGTASPYPRPGQPCSGYLLRAAGDAVWVDAGTGTMAELQRHISLEQLDTLWISHLHPDHCADLLAAYNWLANASQPRRVRVYGPPGWADRFDAVVAANGSSRFADLLDARELHDGLVTEAGGIILLARAVSHSVPTFGLRAEYRGRIIAYSADSGPCHALGALAADADVFVCEAGTTTPREGHLTPEQAAGLAARSNVRQLVLTHLAAGLEPAEAMTRARSANSTMAIVARTYP